MLRERLPGYAGFEAIACDTAGADAAHAPRRRFGMMVFSRHPVLQALRHSLPWPAEPEVMSMPRTALELTVAAPGGLLRVLAVHLEQQAAQVLEHADAGGLVVDKGARAAVGRQLAAQDQILVAGVVQALVFKEPPHDAERHQFLGQNAEVGIGSPRG
jgi:hypothetical protein